jgi:hypothetical protein
LVAAAERASRVYAIVSRGGRPDLAGLDILNRIEAPTLLIVGENDKQVIELNEMALKQLTKMEKNSIKAKCKVAHSCYRMFRSKYLTSSEKIDMGPVVPAVISLLKKDSFVIK